MQKTRYLHKNKRRKAAMCIHSEAFVAHAWIISRSYRERGYSSQRKNGSLDYKNLPRLCTGTGKSTRVSKICSPRRGLPSRGRCKSLTRGWISLSLYKVMVDYFSPTAFNPNNKTPFSLSKTTSKRFLVRKRRQLGLIMTSLHCMIYDVISAVEIRRTCRTIGQFFKMSDKNRQCAGPNVRQKFSDRKKYRAR